MNTFTFVRGCAECTSMAEADEVLVDAPLIPSKYGGELICAVCEQRRDGDALCSEGELVVDFGFEISVDNSRPAFFAGQLRATPRALVAFARPFLDECCRLLNDVAAYRGDIAPFQRSKNTITRSELWFIDDGEAVVAHCPIGSVTLRVPRDDSRH